MIIDFEKYKLNVGEGKNHMINWAPHIFGILSLVPVSGVNSRLLPLFALQGDFCSKKIRTQSISAATMLESPARGVPSS